MDQNRKSRMEKAEGSREDVRGSAAGDLGTANSLGLGVFTGMWCGVGFGFMMGGTLPLGRAR